MYKEAKQEIERLNKQNDLNRKSSEAALIAHI